MDRLHRSKCCRLWIGVFVGAIILVMGGCSPSTRIVLLPDPDGHVGRVVVSSEEGQQILRSAYETTQVSSAGNPPTKPVVLGEAAVKDLFKDALAAQPKLPIHFMLYFISGTNKLTEASIEMISQVICAIENRESTDVSVVGHTDRVGSKTYNQQLSLERAKVVAAMLVSKDINPDIIDITSHGEGNPLIETPDDMAEPRNRRVEITVR